MKDSLYIAHMDYIYAVYQEKSFTRAAEKLYISQPALSQIIKKVESELGYPIFERSGKEIGLTQIGERIIHAITEIKRIQTKAASEIDDILKLKKGNIAIGSTTFVASYILPKILRGFKNKYPDIEINIAVEQSTELEEMLENEQVDIVIDNVTTFIDWYQYAPLLKEHILIGVPREYEINREYRQYQIPHEIIKNGMANYDTLPKIPISKFAGENFILLKKGNKLRQIARHIFDESHVLSNTVMEFDRLHTAVSYAEAGFGICFLSDITLKYSNTCDNLCIYLPETQFPDLTLYIIYKKNRYLSNATGELVKFISETSGSKH